MRDGGAVIFDPDRNKEQFINETGCEIWQLLDGLHSRSAIAEHLQAIFSDDANIYQDIDSYLTLLNQNGWLAKTSPQTTVTSRCFSWHDESPLSFDISITGKCNLKCPFCYYSQAINTRPDLPLHEWQTFFIELQGLGVREVTLSGGEIFCRNDLFAVIDSIIAANMRCSLISNGTLGSTATVTSLLEPHRRQRLNSIQISVDGSGPETHDLIRGHGSFVATDRFLRQLLQAELPVAIRVTISRRNCCDLKATFAYLLDELQIPAVSTNYACQLGSAVENAETIDLTGAERQQTMQELRHLAEKVWPGRINAQAGPLYESRQFENMELQQQHTPAYNGHLTACGCFRAKLAVHHDGIITPCNMLGDIELGRINHHSIKKIWLEHPILKKLASRTGFSLKNVPGCKNCEYVEICNGGCPATVISQTGDFFKPSLDNCYLAFKESINATKNRTDK